MRIGILFKKEKVRDKTIVPRLAEQLKRKGHTVSVLSTGAQIGNLDVLIVLGGDGALLHAAIIAGRLGIKVLGINYGTLGFLSELEASETFSVVDLLEGEYHILPRTILKITVDGREYYALNEAVLQRDYSRPHGNQVADIGVLCDGEKINEYVLDGIAVATPTGSTAYSLSAGGAILAPDAKVFIVTPICPMGLRSRPFVLSDEHTISFDLTKEKYPLRLYADGRPIASVTAENDVRLEKAPFHVDFITRDVNRLFRAVNAKLCK